MLNTWPQGTDICASCLAQLVFDVPERLSLSPGWRSSKSQGASVELPCNHFSGCQEYPVANHKCGSPLKSLGGKGICNPDWYVFHYMLSL